MIEGLRLTGLMNQMQERFDKSANVLAGSPCDLMYACGGEGPVESAKDDLAFYSMRSCERHWS